MTTEKTIEYSTIVTGSGPTSTTTAAMMNVTIHVSEKRDASRGGRNLPQGQPKNCALLYATVSASSIAAPAKAKNIPPSASSSPHRPSATAAASAALPGWSGSMC